MAAMTDGPLPQHMRALAKANVVRLAHAELKRELKRGELTLEDAMKDERAESIAVFDLLMSQHRWGRWRTRRLLGQLSIRDNKQVRELTARQRQAVLDAVKETTGSEA